MRFSGDHAQEFASVIGGRDGDRVGLGGELAGARVWREVERRSGAFGAGGRVISGPGRTAAGWFAGGCDEGEKCRQTAKKQPGSPHRHTFRRNKLLDRKTSSGTHSYATEWRASIQAPIAISRRNQDTVRGEPFIEPCPGASPGEGRSMIRPVRRHGGRPENHSCTGIRFPLEEGSRYDSFVHGWGCSRHI